jgi:hypothetical protein
MVGWLQPSSTVVSFAMPVILSAAPLTADTKADTVVSCTITGLNFGLLDPSADVLIVFGNAGDGTRRLLSPT